MSTTLLHELTKIEKDRQKGGFARGELIKHFQHVADATGESVNKVKNEYYRFIKDKVVTVSFPVCREALIQGKRIRILWDEENEEELVLVDDLIRVTGETPSTKSMLKTKKQKQVEVVGLDGEHDVLELNQTVSYLESVAEYVSDRQLAQKAIAVKNTLKTGGKSEMKPLTLDESIAQHMKNTTLTPDLRYGDIIKVTVQKLTDYGAIVTVDDSPTIKGLIHISKIRDGYVSSVQDYFREGDQLEARVISTIKDGQIGLSTVGMKLKKQKPETESHAPALGGKAHELLELQRKLARQKEEQPPVEQEELNEESKEEKIEEKEVKPVMANDNSELTHIVTYLNGVVGALSPDAKKALAELVEEKGVFKFTMAMMEASKGFQNDLGLMFIKEIQTVMSDSL